MIAKHMYSLNKRAAVCHLSSTCYPVQCLHLTVCIACIEISRFGLAAGLQLLDGRIEEMEDEKGSNHLLPGTCPVLDGVG